MVAKKAIKKSSPAPKKKVSAKETVPKRANPAPKKEVKKVFPAPKAGSSKFASKTPALKTVGKEKAVPAKAEISYNGPLGKKFTCYSCNTKFYDLNKPEKKCPKCGGDQLAKPAIKSRLAALKHSEYEVEEEPQVEEDETLEETEEAEVEAEAEEEAVAEEEE